MSIETANNKAVTSETDIIGLRLRKDGDSKNTPKTL
jgi:hypothetical protein